MTTLTLTSKELQVIFEKADASFKKNGRFIENDYFKNKYSKAPMFSQRKDKLSEYFRSLFKVYSFAAPNLLDFVDPNIIKLIRTTMEPIDGDVDPKSKNMSFKLLMSKMGNQLIDNILTGMFEELNDEYLLGLTKEEIAKVMGIVVESDETFIKDTGIYIRILKPFFMETLVLKNLKNAINKYALPFNARFANYTEDKMMGVDIVVEHIETDLSLSPLYFQVKPMYQAIWAFENLHKEIDITSFTDMDQKNDDYWKLKISRTITAQRQRADNVLWLGYTYGSNAKREKRIMWINGQELKFTASGQNGSFEKGYNVDYSSCRFLSELIKSEFLNASGFDVRTGEYDRMKDKKKEAMTHFDNAQKSDKSDLKEATIKGERIISNMAENLTRLVSQPEVEYSESKLYHDEIYSTEESIGGSLKEEQDTAIIDPLDILYAIANEDLLTKERKVVQKQELYDAHYEGMPIKGF